MSASEASEQKRKKKEKKKKLFSFSDNSTSAWVIVARRGGHSRVYGELYSILASECGERARKYTSLITIYHT